VETTVTLLGDDSDFRGALDEAADLLHLGFDGDIETLGLDQLLEFPLDFAEVENMPTSSTGEMTVRIKRGKRLIELLSALRACNLASRHVPDVTTLGPAKP
jgi:hypothetical protein